MPPTALSLLEALPWVVCLVILVAVQRTARSVLASDDDPIAEVHELYQNGAITESEMERRIAHLVDDRNERIRRVVEEVNGIGPSRAAGLARSFDSVADLETASVDELRRVNGIGPQRAAAINAYLSPGHYDAGDLEGDLESQP